MAYDDYITTDLSDRGDPRCEGCGRYVMECCCGPEEAQVSEGRKWVMFTAKPANCQCIVAACVDRKDEDTAADVAQWVRDGLRVEQVLVESVAVHRCVHRASYGSDPLCPPSTERSGR